MNKDILFAQIRAKDFHTKSVEDLGFESFVEKFNTEHEKDLRKKAFGRGLEADHGQ